MSDIFREVDEDMRRDQLKGLWQQYGIYAISIIMAIVLGVAGRAFWNNYTFEKQTAESERYDQAITMVAAGDTVGALSVFDNISNETSGGYGVLAQFQMAAQKIENDDKAAALAIYDSLRDNSGVDERLVGLATLLGGITALDVETADQVRTRLTPLAVYGENWYFSAQEFLALLALRNGEMEEAIGIYSGLSSDETAPAGVRSRAGEILAVIENADLGGNQ